MNKYITIDHCFVNSGSGPNGFAELMNDIFVAIAVEMTLITNAFYNTPKTEDGVFTLIERSWIGILSDSIKRADKEAVSLQEFNVWSDISNIGRCDFLFQSQANTYLVEAKTNDHNPNWNLLAFSNTFPMILNQAQTYFNAEEKYYRKDQTYIIAIVFERIATVESELISKVKNQVEKLKTGQDIHCDFYAFYQGTKKGVNIYGRIIKATEPIVIQ